MTLQDVNRCDLTSVTSFSSIMSDFVTAVFRLLVHQFLSSAIPKGSLIFKTATHDDVIFDEKPSAAEGTGRPVAQLFLVDPPSYYARVLTAPDIGFDEAFIAGDFTVARSGPVGSIKWAHAPVHHRHQFQLAAA